MGCAKLSKVGLLIFNILFLLGGIGIIVVGAIFTVDGEKYGVSSATSIGMRQRRRPPWYFLVEGGPSPNAPAAGTWLGGVRPLSQASSSPAVPFSSSR